VRQLVSRPRGHQLLAELAGGSARFNRLKEALPGVNAKTLSSLLRGYQAAGLLDRRVIAARPLAVQYSITPAGRALLEIMERMVAWETGWGEQ
jgi:DNA-binding HxlR family transcriptional regulator